MLARALQRRREIGVRLALGVSRRRLFGQMLTESVLLALLSGLAGLLMARLTSATLFSLFSVADAGHSSIDRTNSCCSQCSSTLLVGVVTGLAPAMHGMRSDLLTALKTGVRDGGQQRARMRSTLVVVQGALSVLLLVGAGLFVRSLSNVRSMRLGYDADKLIWIGRVMRERPLVECGGRGAQPPAPRGSDASTGRGKRDGGGDGAVLQSRVARAVRRRHRLRVQAWTIPTAARFAELLQDLGDARSSPDAGSRATTAPAHRRSLS